MTFLPVTVGPLCCLGHAVLISVVIFICTNTFMVSKEMRVLVGAVAQLAAGWGWRRLWEGRQRQPPPPASPARLQGGAGKMPVSYASGGDRKISVVPRS